MVKFKVRDSIGYVNIDPALIGHACVTVATPIELWIFAYNSFPCKMTFERGDDIASFNAIVKALEERVKCGNLIRSSDQLDMSWAKPTYYIDAATLRQTTPDWHFYEMADMDLNDLLDTLSYVAIDASTSKDDPVHIKAVASDRVDMKKTIPDKKVLLKALAAAGFVKLRDVFGSFDTYYVNPKRIHCVSATGDENSGVLQLHFDDATVYLRFNNRRNADRKARSLAHASRLVILAEQNGILAINPVNVVAISVGKEARPGKRLTNWVMRLSTTTSISFDLQEAEAARIRKRIQRLNEFSIIDTLSKKAAARGKFMAINIEATIGLAIDNSELISITRDDKIRRAIAVPEGVSLQRSMSMLLGYKKPLFARSPAMIKKYAQVSHKKPESIFLVDLTGVKAVAIHHGSVSISYFGRENIIARIDDAAQAALTATLEKEASLVAASAEGETLYLRDVVGMTRAEDTYCMVWFGDGDVMSIHKENWDLLYAQLGFSKDAGAKLRRSRQLWQELRAA